MSDPRHLRPDQLQAERARWRAFARGRPAHVEAPGPGQESVWDYPRPPEVRCEARLVRIFLAGRSIAESGRALRVCETSSPPTVYVPVEDVARQWLEPAEEQSLCEWKGIAHFWNARVGERFVPAVGWSYPEPDEGFEMLRDHLAFYPGRVDVCTLDGEPVRPQPGGFYGGWVTREIVGPFKGEPGSEHW
jgi:uncharacterized protein (DUF427 family)